MTQTVYFHGTREELKQKLYEVPAMLNGHGSDPGIVQGLLAGMGMETLSIFKEAYVAKSRGGADEAGEVWPKLDPKTIAYGRRHPELSGARTRAKAEGRPGRPLLTKEQNDRWKKLYANTFAALVRDGDTEADAKAHAAAWAWTVLKAEGARTIINEFGNAEVEILADTRRLLNSLSPGEAGHSGDPNQIFRLEPGEVIVGTNVRYAGRHHRGDPAKGLPQRRLWPEASRWPGRWWDRLTYTLADGTAQLLKWILGV